MISCKYLLRRNNHISRVFVGLSICQSVYITLLYMSDRPYLSAYMSVNKLTYNKREINIYSFYILI